jgi:hypothetical protein
MPFCCIEKSFLSHKDYIPFCKNHGTSVGYSISYIITLLDKINVIFISGDHVMVQCVSPSCGDYVNLSDVIAEIMELDGSKNDIQQCYNIQNRILEYYNILIKCSNPKCEHYFKSIQKENRVKCPKCDKKFCKQCKAYPYHHKLTCVKHLEKELKRTKSGNKINSNTIMCPKCYRKINKFTGCNMMTCNTVGTDIGCGAKFCYKCGKNLSSHDRPHDHTNDCPGKIIPKECVIL